MFASLTRQDGDDLKVIADAVGKHLRWARYTDSTLPQASEDEDASGDVNCPVLIETLLRATADRNAGLQHMPSYTPWSKLAPSHQTSTTAVQTQDLERVFDEVVDAVF